MRGTAAALALLLAARAALGAAPFPPALAPYVRPTVRKPFGDGVAQILPQGLGNQALARIGLVDVRAAPFHADPTGRRDATRAIQQAIIAARNAQMVCFFPTGTYRVSDTIECVQDLYQRTNGKILGGRLHPCVLVGERAAERPRIVLAPNSPGFGDPEQPKYVIHFWARSTADPKKPQPNISMNQMLVNLDIAIGEGNPGAVAVRHRAAQGSGVQECRIDATHGLTGLEGGAGSGGGHANVTVIGGRIGLDLRETQPAPTVSGIELLGQTQAAILCSSRQALSAVGIRIVSHAPGPLIRTTAPKWAPHNGPICLVDSSIECGAPNTTVLHAERSAYLNNVFVRGAAQIARNADGSSLAGRPDGWTHVVEYARGIDPPRWRKLQYRAPIYVNGKPVGNNLAVVSPGAPSPGLVRQHLLPADFPGPCSKGVANVTAPPYNARGDGEMDDTAAIQRAIDEHDGVLIPKGYFRVSRTIRLRPSTRLIGVAQHLSVLLAHSREGDFADASDPQPVLQTPDDADAETAVAFCGVFVPYHVPGAYALEWRAGRHSICRSIMCRRAPLYGHRRQPAGWEPRETGAPAVVVRGHGGGRWFNFYAEGHYHQTDAYRHLLVDGSSEPLAIYQCNAEHARTEANMEVRRARFVSIYGLKGEGNYPILKVCDSDHVRVFGYGGNAAAYERTALFVVERTPNFLIANAVDSPRLAGQGSDEHFAGRGVDPGLWHMIQEVPPKGQLIRTRPMERPVLYRRGQPRAE